MKRAIVGLAVAAFFLAVGGGAAAQETKLGAFKLKTADGQEFTQENLKDKKTLFVVAQTACTQCRAEMKDISARYEDFSAKGQVFVVLVDANPERGLKFYKEQGYKMPLLLDPDFRVPKMAGVEVTPGVFIVGPDLAVTYTKTGYRAGDLERFLDKF